MGANVGYTGGVVEEVAVCCFGNWDWKWWSWVGGGHVEGCELVGLVVSELT